MANNNHNDSKGFAVNNKTTPTCEHCSNTTNLTEFRVMVYQDDYETYNFCSDCIDSRNDANDYDTNEGMMAY